MSEITPYVRDPVECDKCNEQAEYYCPYCKALDQPVNVCMDHAVSTNKGLRCYRCNKKLHRIQPRFVGSYRPMKKYIENRPVKLDRTPNIHGPDERDSRIPRNELENTSSYSRIPRKRIWEVFAKKVYVKS